MSRMMSDPTPVTLASVSAVFPLLLFETWKRSLWGNCYWRVAIRRMAPAPAGLAAGSGRMTSNQSSCEGGTSWKDISRYIFNEVFIGLMIKYWLAVSVSVVELEWQLCGLLCDVQWTLDICKLNRGSSEAFHPPVSAPHCYPPHTRDETARHMWTRAGYGGGGGGM